MLLYNVRIALKSLRRSPVLTALIIGGIMLGITVSTLFLTIKHSFAKDPIPNNRRLGPAPFDILGFVSLCKTGTYRPQRPVPE